MRIRLSYYFANEPLFRQTPGGLGVWKGHIFHGNDPSVEQCDIWVVLDDPRDKESALVNSGRAVLITLEPPLTREYRPAFLAQFDLVVSCHRDLRHPNVRNEYQGQTWHIGMHKGADANDRPSFRGTMGYDEFVQMAPLEKTAALSVICSTSSRLPGHRLRRDFVAKLQWRLGDRVDVFGRGVRPIPDKADAILPYRYHIALENSRLPNYWTEKLSDSYLGWAFPIYWGCENIGDYFSGDSLLQIDIARPAEAIDLIESAMNQELRPARMAGLAAARELVLDRYNTFDVIRRHCETLQPREPREIVIRPQRHFQSSRLRRNVKRIVRTVASCLSGERS
jgi:Glycosyltransferase family 10 (fucosyltransferase) C-term